MCGVIGAFSEDRLSRDDLQDFLKLAKQSRVRGLHACGLSWPDPSRPTLRCVTFYRGFDPFKAAVDNLADNPPWALIGHTRYSTSGDWTVDANNQPLRLRERTLVFNGVVSQAEKPQYEAEFGVQCDSDNDGEVFLRLAERPGFDPARFVAEIRGSFAGIWLEPPVARAVRNDRRPLWEAKRAGVAFVASTRDILARAGLGGLEQRPVPPGTVLEWRPRAG